MKKRKWHSLEKSEIIKLLNSKETGLTKEEANKRLNKYGKNELPKKKQDSVFKIFFKGLIDPIVILLLVAMLFSFLINETIDGLAITFIIIIDLILGTYQEWRAERNAEALSKLIEVKVKVMRDNLLQEIDSSEIVPGDIIYLESGSKVCADARILNCDNATVDEAVLTGESLSVTKNAKELKNDTILAEHTNMVYAGTSVLTGRITAIAVETGANTEVGQIANKVAETKETKSPLTIRMEKFSKQITIIVIIIAILLTILLSLKKVPGTEIFLSVIALSVSAMPEGLPLALTMALTIASNRMSKKNVIVKRLNSVESLGSCTVIASDKTGTLTVNEQTAKKILLPDGKEYEITGTGYNDKGELISKNSSSLEYAKEIAKNGVLNNEAKLYREGKEFEHFGDSIDIAFLALGLKANVTIEDTTITKKIPYESEKKYSAVFYEEKNKLYCTAKGSVEKILSFSTTMQLGNKKVPVDKKLIEKQNDELASAGYRVIAVSSTEVSKDNELKVENLNFLGLVAFIDPIRDEVINSIEECKTAGIKTIMITGDHPLTAFAIGKELGMIENFNEVVTGSDVDKYLELGTKEFDSFIKDKKIFSRVTPLNKLEIVESFKRQGEFIAVTGDGVNDAPALKAANIGIAMGSGTDVAKETASMIILDDNFKSIVQGIKEGRCAYSNIRKVSYMLLSCGLAEVLFFVASILFGLPMPLVAIQLLWLNIVTDGLQDFALSFEKAERGIMKEKSRDPKENIFNRAFAEETIISGLTIGLLVTFLWIFLLKYMQMDAPQARSYVMTLMVFIQNMHVLNCRSEKDSAFSISPKSNYLIVFSIASAVILQIVFSEVPTLSRFLQVESIPVAHLALLFVISTFIIFVIEIYKSFKYKRN